MRSVAATALLLTAFAAPWTGATRQAIDSFEVIQEVAKRARESGRAYMPFFARDSLSCGIYRLAAGAKDGQSPHHRDEVYYVLAGRAKMTAAGETRDVAPGTALFVGARTEHRFHDITEDLEVLVFFSNLPRGQEKEAVGDAADRELKARERAWLDAYDAGDAVAMGDIVADGFVITYEDGRAVTKAQLMANLKPRPKPEKSHQGTENTKIRRFGDTAILTGIYVNSRPGRPERRLLYTDTWMRIAGKWRVVGSQLAKAVER